MKQLVSHARYGRLLPANDPYVALQRDGRSASMAAPFSDDAALLKAVNEGPMTALDALVAQHRKSHVKLIQAMQEAEARHSKVRIPSADVPFGSTGSPIIWKCGLLVSNGQVDSFQGTPSIVDTTAVELAFLSELSARIGSRISTFHFKSTK